MASPSRKRKRSQDSNHNNRNVEQDEEEEEDSTLPPISIEQFITKGPPSKKKKYNHIPNTSSNYFQGKQLLWFGP